MRMRSTGFNKTNGKETTSFGNKILEVICGHDNELGCWQERKIMKYGRP